MKITCQTKQERLQYGGIRVAFCAGHAPGRATGPVECRQNGGPCKERTSEVASGRDREIIVTVNVYAVIQTGLAAIALAVILL